MDKFMEIYVYIHVDSRHKRLLKGAAGAYRPYKCLLELSSAYKFKII